MMGAPLTVLREFGAMDFAVLGYSRPGRMPAIVRQGIAAAKLRATLGGWFLVANIHREQLRFLILAMSVLAALALLVLQFRSWTSVHPTRS